MCGCVCVSVLCVCVWCVDVCVWRGVRCKPSPTGVNGCNTHLCSSPAKELQVAWREPSNNNTSDLISQQIMVQGFPILLISRKIVLVKGFHMQPIILTWLAASVSASHRGLAEMCEEENSTIFITLQQPKVSQTLLQEQKENSIQPLAFLPMSSWIYTCREREEEGGRGSVCFS